MYTGHMHISELFDSDLLQEMLDGGYVSTQTHPTDSLVIYNYTPAAQYERVWNYVTMESRGLIVDSVTGEVVARPFPKFFNYEEAIEAGLDLPKGDPIVTDKMDGSLGIIYMRNGVPAVATRGSFASEQALWATEYLHRTYPAFAQPEGVTTLVEIIYPQNRIVVDYEGAEGLWLLGAIDNETGADIDFNDIDWWAGPRTVNYGYRDIEDAVAMGVGLQYAEDEGVVLCWPREDAPSVRLKVKHPRYVELHRIVTGLSTRTVWEALANDDFDQLLEAAPDEFHPWVRNVESGLRQQFAGIYARANYELGVARNLARGASPEYTRRDLAKYLTDRSSVYTGLCFALEDGKDITPRIWQMIKPERSMAMIVTDDN